MEVTSSVVLPVSAALMTAFSSWIVQTYRSYDTFMGALKDPAMDLYIIENILPVEMQTVMLTRIDQFRGAKKYDIHTQRMQLYRKRITAKMKNLKEKVGKLTFPNETAMIRTANREAAANRRRARDLMENQMREAYMARDAAFAATFNEPFPVYVQQQPIVFASPTIVKVHLGEEDEDVCMEGDCVICMINHKMTDSCIISNCGHQFGNKCLKKWTGRGGASSAATCPLCRTVVTEITEFTYDGMHDGH